VTRTLCIGIDGRALQHPQFRDRGIGRYLRELVAAIEDLSPPDTEIELLLDRDLPLPVMGRSSSLVHALPVDLPVARRNGVRRDFLTLLRQHSAVARIARARRHDVFFSPTHLLLPLTRFAMPHVCTVHDAIPHALWRDNWKVLPAATLTAIAARRATFLVTPSAQSAHDAAHFYRISATRIFSIPEASAAAFAPVSSNKAKAITEQYELVTPFALYVGPAGGRRDMVALFDALAVLDDLQLVIAGAADPNARSVLDREARQRGVERRVRVLGFVNDDDLPALYTAAAVFVFPSRYEGFGLPVLEAMACGTSVVAFDCGAVQEVAGSAALLVPVGDHAAFAESVRLAVYDEPVRNRLTAEGLSRARQFTWTATAAATLSLLRHAAFGTIRSRELGYEEANR
jgi:glycosyltransferase involved in cell wall biosynthesis